MDDVYETPTAKRRKLGEGRLSQGACYDSENESVDSLLNGNAYETVATLPLQNKSTPTQLSYITQPTQLIRHSSPNIHGSKDPVVQVAASSPADSLMSKSPVSKSPTPRNKFGGGILASAMAPPGTVFRLPQGVPKPPPAPLRDPDAAIPLSDSDEDVPRYRGASSDEDTQTARRADIKPSSFKSSIQQQPPAEKFKSTLANSFYKPAEPSNKTSNAALWNRKESQFPPTPKRSADVMANAYGGSGKANRPASVASARSTKPVKTSPTEDLHLHDIEDYQARSKVARMRNVLPSHSVLSCYNSLIRKKGNYDDAMDLLTSMEEQPTTTDGHLDSEPELRLPAPRKPTAKQQIRIPNQSIHEKWSATQKFQKPIELSSSPPTAALKPRRRLVQGRRAEQTTAVPSPKLELVEPSAAVSPPRHVSRPISVDSDSDSGVGTELEDTVSESRLLDWLNTCTAADLADCAATSEETAQAILSHKPFDALEDVRRISQGAKGKKVKSMGNKILDKCLEMWTGYDAIDKLVQECAYLRTSVQAEMEKWGVDFMGASSNGELELADLNIDFKSRDSGIGTPTSRDVSADEDAGGNAKALAKRRNGGFFSQPSIMAPGIVVKDYQLVGINWLRLLFDKNLSCILADDMGLGKTCQVIAFLAHLLERGIPGPHLVIVPGSTLENWLREFKTFCPRLNVVPYYAGLNERPGIQADIEDNLASINVVVTTYTIAKAKMDNSFLRKLKPVCTIFDEGHLLRNSKSAGYGQYMRIPCKFRLLLTGTPLQNNLKELASLLGFILPSLFKEHSEALEAVFGHKAKTSDNRESHAALLSAQRISRAKTMMTPFVLRRKKHQVLKDLPAKHRTVQHCELSASQKQIYDDESARAMSVLRKRKAGEKTGSETTNVMMSLRKASIHPLLFRHRYNDEMLTKMSKACLKEEEFAESNVNLVFEDMSVMTDMELHQFCDRYPDSVGEYRLENDPWMDSGKVKALTELLRKHKANGDRVLVFSQFVMVLNILESVLETLDMQFFRLDGSTKIDERQDMIDQFYKEPEITVFLLSTGAGGAGINLACANKVVIFDSSFNPQMDIQAENRAHRVGQSREVEVVRLVTRGTIEEQIYALGETKLALDDRVAGVTGEQEPKSEKEGQDIVAEMMMAQIEEGGKTQSDTKADEAKS